MTLTHVANMRGLLSIVTNTLAIKKFHLTLYEIIYDFSEFLRYGSWSSFKPFGMCRITCLHDFSFDIDTSIEAQDT